MQIEPRFQVGDRVFDKWHSLEWKVDDIRDFWVTLKSTNNGETMKLMESTLRDIERFLKVHAKEN